MSDFPQVIKKLTITPVVEGVSPRAKSSAIVGDISDLSEYLTIPSYISTEPAPYVRQLLFQYNYSLDHDFFLLNIDSYRAYNSFLVQGGTLCIKYRIGETVFRYKLFDSQMDEDWSFFETYSNQIIKKNFCLEFWSNTIQADESVHGVMQAMILKTSKIVSRTNVAQTDEYSDVSNPPYVIDELAAINNIFGLYLTFAATPLLSELEIFAPVNDVLTLISQQQLDTDIADLIAATVLEINGVNGYACFEYNGGIVLVPPSGITLIPDVNCIINPIGGMTLNVDSTSDIAEGEVLPSSQDNLAWLDNV